MKPEKTYTANGETRTLREWAQILDIHPEVLRERIRVRLKKGMTEDDAVLEPPMPFEKAREKGSRTTPWRAPFNFGRRLRQRR